MVTSRLGIQVSLHQRFIAAHRQQRFADDFEVGVEVGGSCGDNIVNMRKPRLCPTSYLILGMDGIRPRKRSPHEPGSTP